MNCNQRTNRGACNLVSGVAHSTTSSARTLPAGSHSLRPLVRGTCTKNGRPGSSGSSGSFLQLQRLIGSLPQSSLGNGPIQHLLLGQAKNMYSAASLTPMTCSRSRQCSCPLMQCHVPCLYCAAPLVLCGAVLRCRLCDAMLLLCCSHDLYATIQPPPLYYCHATVRLMV